MALNTQEQILIEQRVTNEAKSPVVAYLLWFFVGWFGAHRFYLGATGSAVAILLLSLVGLATAVFGVGLIVLAVVAIWLIVDIFLIPGMVDRQRNAMRVHIANQMVISGRPDN